MTDIAMNDHDALLRAIGEHPEEDTPRLMYADWLEENGQPERADFVRAQVELARPGLSPAERYPSVRKNVYYLTNFVRHWRDQLPQLPGIEWGDFNRGLIEEVRAATEGPIVEHAAEVFAVPGIHVLRLWRLNDAQLLAAVPELIRLRSFRLINGAPAATLRALFASPYLAQLIALDLYRSHVTDALAAELADGRFPDLAELGLGSNTIGDGGASALANSPHLSHLRLLDLRNNRICDPTVQTALRRRFGSALKL
jgi:uncharacterized protein (TIGR02996 family)